MEPRKMMKQMMDFYKAGFDNSFKAFVMIQEQMERMSTTTMEQFMAVPEEAKKAFQDWSKTYKKGCEDFRKAVDENFKRVEGFFAEPEKAEKPKATSA